MPMSPTKVFFEETCLASKEAMPFELLKTKLMSRLKTMGIRITKTYEEEWSYIPVGGSLPNTEQKNLAFGAAASMVHPATGYSVVRSLSEAPNYAAVIAKILGQRNSKQMVDLGRYTTNISKQAWETLWPLERKRQRAFFLFGLALIVQMDIEGTRTFFRLPTWMWWGFLGSSLSSTDLIVFEFYMFIIAPHSLRMGLVRHLRSDPTGATMYTPILQTFIFLVASLVVTTTQLWLQRNTLAMAVKSINWRLGAMQYSAPFLNNTTMGIIDCVHISQQPAFDRPLLIA
ncbi:putative lycopene epsilon-cyclase [Helianthus annuus]|nr:putative lycopene epsilon-cyclase [Helianthus annuus]